MDFIPGKIDSMSENPALSNKKSLFKLTMIWIAILHVKFWFRLKFTGIFGKAVEYQLTLSF